MSSDRLEQGYGSSDPDMPLPVADLPSVNGTGSFCEDEWVLERWRVMGESPRTIFFAGEEFGVAQ